jgi:hypothetical protein
MDNLSEPADDRLWKEYSAVFRDFDDLTLARWMAQTLGQLAGRAWRLSHPLVAAYRLAAQVGHQRQIWFKRMATAPAAYQESACCRSPLLPLFTRDIVDMGLICQHCGETAVAFDDLPKELHDPILKWVEKYQPVHKVAHWDDAERKQARNYDAKLEEAAQKAERLLETVGKVIVPKLLDSYAAIVWEDQDECLEVQPEDLDVSK